MITKSKYPILPNKKLTNIKVLLSDVDDTLTWQGKLPTSTYASLEKLKERGIKIILVTGACAGWCDLMIRTWPIDYVIGENGAFWFNLNHRDKLEKHFFLTKEERLTNQIKLNNCAKIMSEQIPDLVFAQDQNYRLTDIAYDIKQDKVISQDIIQAAIQILAEHKINYSLSSIHINTWLGNYNKAICALKLLKTINCKDLNSCAFVGDSANDELMFKHFTQSFAVANIKHYLDKMSYKPKYILNNNGGHGFTELSNMLLSSAEF